MKVVYKGGMQRVLHRGVKMDRAARPYEFIQNLPLEVANEDDLAMFKGMAETNPETWEVIDLPKKVAKIARKIIGGDE